jgi:hypothetical protein
MRCKIDNETIEVYALGRLRDPELDAHVPTCRQCQERIIEARSWDTFLHRAKKWLIEASPPYSGDKR